MTAMRKFKLLLYVGALLLFLYIELRMLSNVNDDFMQALSTEVFLLSPMNALSQVGQLVSNINQTKIEVQSQHDAVTPSHHSEEIPEKFLGPSESMHDMNESFSACLLVMDDNFRLYEWIAYHYHVLPLRYLVVAADPRSKNFPNPVLDLFRQQLNMTIVSWNDSDYISWDDRLAADAGVLDKVERHRSRQRRFLAKCLRHMRQHNRTWTALWDTDEYIAFNVYNLTRQNAATNLSATSPHDMSEAGSILRYLKEFGEDNGLSIKRILVGNSEIPSLMNESHPFDPRRFDTLRYRFRAKHISKLNGHGKCMLNVQKIRFRVTVRNPHRPVVDLCPGAKGERLVRNPFFLHHFIGSWEAYSYRDDGRRGSERTYKAYVERAQQSDVYENKLSSWMPAFVENVGEVRASVLLQNAGLDPEYNASFKIDDFKVVNTTVYPGSSESVPVVNDSFSACLLVMDDNFRLYEWIAYHYHVLPLRYLVVAADSRSKQLPNLVLDLFRQQLNMTIVSWNDSDFMSWDEPLAADAGVLEKKYRHQHRQRSFLAKCLRHMHQHRRTWTALWDVDEYIAFNGYNWTRQNAATNLSATSPHDMAEAGSILRYLKEFGEDRGLSVKRILVGSSEMPSLMNESHPFDPRRFDTLRYRFRAKTNSTLNGHPKCMLNVQKISSFPVAVTNPHYPVVALCPNTKGVPVLRFPFFVNHFIGSWEAYSYRDDGRRGSEKTYRAYVERAQQSDVYENKMSQWMPAFVENVGEVRARVLLQNAGLDPEYNASFKIDDFKVVNLTW